uniref:Uncharacterized protein n=1 Tax=Tanacetum cinerariifolium TaxID=118510 RepID=A0A699U4L7_TANCI|nr:hypothetical protein [Tanacetum cinerariifolium]
MRIMPAGKRAKAHGEVGRGFWYCSGVELEGLSSWDLDKTTWGGRFKLFGTVPVCCKCIGKVNGGGLVLAGKLGKRVLFGWLGYSDSSPILVRF